MRIELLAVRGNAGRIFLGHKGQFLVEINIGAHMPARVDGIEDSARHFDLICAGDNGFNSGFDCAGYAESATTIQLRCP